MGRRRLGWRGERPCFQYGVCGDSGANGESMILLITPTAKVQECANSIVEATDEKVQVAGSLRHAASQLRAQEYSAIVIDQSLVEAEPDDSELIVQHFGSAIPVYVNFAISGVGRVVRDLRIALSRRNREVVVARKAAEQALRSELKGSVTALLLSCEMALKVPNLPESAESKLRRVQELAGEVRSKIGMTA